ncbi:MAG: hypothetical protein RL660_1799 [Bacteroidota bacterium]
MVIFLFEGFSSSRVKTNTTTQYANKSSPQAELLEIFYAKNLFVKVIEFFAHKFLFAKTVPQALFLQSSMATYTILSDFGEQNYLSAAVKGCIYTVDAQARIVDISHDIQAFNVYQASYVFRGAFRFYPAGSHHLLLCGLYNTNHKHLLISKVMDQYIYHVDNELAHLAFDYEVPCRKLRLEEEFEYKVGNIASAFAQASSLINRGALLQDFTDEYRLQEIPKDLRTTEHDNQITVHVLFIDNFHNVILNLKREEFETYRRGRNYKIEFVGNEYITELSESYNSVEMGSAVAFFNDAGYLEIAIRAGQASSLFGFEAPEFKDNSLEYELSKNAIYRAVIITFEN